MTTIIIGGRYRFDYPHQFEGCEYSAHSGHMVRVRARVADDPDADEGDTDRAFQYFIRADDGWTGYVCADELTPAALPSPTDPITEYYADRIASGQSPLNAHR